ncbi:MAG: hypothetical protein M4D80_27135 [Myxococcota bacterium]|nr:hypothetical protein [Deltaproteobacteria bacterium]MDQ3338856.1 hypothetical protein [Myxococcota bacterium]
MTRRFAVQPKAGGLIFGALFFGACAVVLLYQATRPTHLVIQNVLELSSEHARIVVLVLAALSVGFVGIALTVLVRRRVKELVITEKAVILDARAIRFDELLTIEEHRVYGQVFLTVRSRHQKLVITKSHLRDGAYDEVVALVRTRARRS